MATYAGCSSCANANADLNDDPASPLAGGGFLTELGKLAIPLGLYAAQRGMRKVYPDSPKGRSSSPRASRRKATTRGGGGASWSPAPFEDQQTGGAVAQQQQQQQQRALISSEFRRMAAEINLLLSRPRDKSPARAKPAPAPRKPVTAKKSASAKKKPAAAKKTKTTRVSK
jgi:hypothetical protein